MLLPLLG